MEHVQHLIALCSSDAAIGGGLLLGLFLAGAAVLMTEYAPRERRGFFGKFFGRKAA